jgi:hypothetical protein
MQALKAYERQAALGSASAQRAHECLIQKCLSTRQILSETM